MRLSRNVRRFSQPLSIVSCTDKLVQNDPSFVELSLERLGEEFDLDEFVIALRANHTVKHVCFSGTFVRELQDDQWRSLLESVGYLTALEELQIWCSTIPVAVFAHTLRHAQQLRKIYFFRVVLEGNLRDFEEFSDSLRGHECLRDFRIGGFQLNVTDEDETETSIDNNNNNNNDNDNTDPLLLDCVLQAMAETSSLCVVSLQLTGVTTSTNGTPFSGQALQALLHSTSIEDVYLSRLGLSQEHYTAIAESLPHNTTLKILDLFGNNLTDEQIAQISKGLQQNTGLETLVLPCPATDMSVEASEAISQALQSNATLVTLNLPRSSFSDEGLYHLSTGLTINTTLKKIEVGVSKNISDKGKDALHQMLETNTQLERLVVSSAEKSLKEKVEYYMRLNEKGRGSLLKASSFNRTAWIQMLIDCNQDLDCLFYFLTMNPSLCQYANTTTKTPILITQEFRPALSRRHSVSDCQSREAIIYSKEQLELMNQNRRASAF